MLIKLSASVQDTYNEVYGQSASLELLTHLKCKLFQAVLSYILLQPEILKAYSSGILFDCLDGKLCRLFPRFAFYLADYPEKMLIASLCVLGKFLSPTDIMLTKFNHMLGTRADQQRQTHKCIDDTVQ
ncbi:uncharacterized protein FOMMEDRAFT_83009 [Fomitiporia mediterranea MF3/22]|uniref:uncharacterized protein n=1 Tax=Fomitiporia mediterranea (strain MF3/22) TaxID=694068 RepID=UPI0004408573|nr:uncharacterized protein FOMMEDRAFT_83009 [Fomitiporia mediterranea MF3/22]EJD04601.1 hypothetical protein FOMMEDRAFT_83009 [Fomitiporia mediterranea MF3/22]